MAKSDAELKQLILNRRARFVAAAMCTSGIVLSACREGEGDPIIGSTVNEPTGTTTTSVGPTVCLSTVLPPQTPPTACLGAPNPFPTPCLSIVEDPGIIPLPPVEPSPDPSTSEPSVCLSPPYPTEQTDSTNGFPSSSSREIVDAGADAGSQPQTSSASSTSTPVEVDASAVEAESDTSANSNSTP